jgi:hypothetical protein
MRNKAIVVTLLIVGSLAGSSLAATAAATSVVLKARLTGAYLRTTSAATGTATITIAPSKVCWKFSYRRLDKPNDSGIHIAPPPAAGKHKTSVFPFTATTSQAHQCVSPTKWGPNGPSWLAKIAANPGRFYVIIATTKYPQGAIGGVLKLG